MHRQRTKRGAARKDSRKVLRLPQTSEEIRLDADSERVWDNLQIEQWSDRDSSPGVSKLHKQEQFWQRSFDVGVEEYIQLNDKHAINQDADASYFGKKHLSQRKKVPRSPKPVKVEVPETIKAVVSPVVKQEKPRQPAPPTRAHNNTDLACDLTPPRRLRPEVSFA